MAWELLTKVYKIPPERLYVTYFHGDPKMNLPADEECREVWRSIGVTDERIVGFGMKENFWEMGSTGPCGGCSEIHIDHLPSYRDVNRAIDVNADKSDLTEIWNIVFIEYFRNPDGTVKMLPKKHVDTGMGFERLVAFLQGKDSNYDSDLFTPIFDKIQRTTGAPAYSGAFNGSSYEIDTAYRVLADHSRMVAVSLADGMFPEQNQKLRRVLRKCINISEKDFKKSNLLIQTVPVVAEILGETFDELRQKLPLMLELVKYEQELFRSLREVMAKDVTKIINENPKLAELEIFDFPGFIQGYEDLKTFKKSHKKLSGEFMYYIHSSFGFDLEFIERLAALEGLETETAAFQEKLAEVKKNSSGKMFNDDTILSLNRIVTETTDDSLKYDYKYDANQQSYHMVPVSAKLLKIIDGRRSVNNTQGCESDQIQLIFDKTPFYFESGGQEGDNGTIAFKEQIIPLKSLSKFKNSILHGVSRKSCNISVGDEVELKVDSKRRSALIRNHSATHLLNAAMRQVTKSPIYQKSSLVTEDQLKIELACFGPKLNHEITKEIEQVMRSKIIDSIDRRIQILNSQQLQDESEVVMVPGEIYPDDGIRLLTFGDFSKELCCGTHVLNTSELLEFAFLSMRSTGRNSYLLSAATGDAARKAIELGEKLLDELKQLSSDISSQNFNYVLTRVREITVRLNNLNNPISFVKKLECNEVIAEIKEKAKHESREILGVLLDIEMNSLIERYPEAPYYIHYLECSDLMKSVSLLKATRYVRDRPVMIFSVTDSSILKARCCVPSKLATESFNAELWLREASKVVRAQISPPKDQNPWEACNMKEKRVKSEQLDNVLNDAIASADGFARSFFKRILQNENDDDEKKKLLKKC